MQEQFENLRKAAKITPEEELQKIQNEVVLINPREPNYEGIGIGIEITTQGYKGLNLDHHGEGYTSDSPSAIEQALELNLHELPEGKIATVRSDLDSAGAIAVLMLRREDIEPDPILISAIGLLDRKGPGIFKKEGWRKVPRVSQEEFKKISRVISAARYKIISKKTSLPEAVQFMKRLLGGQLEDSEIESLYEQDQKELEEAKKSSTIELFAGRKTVFVESGHLRAFELGYEEAPIVVAYNPNYRWPDGKVTQKYTIARYDSNVIELNIAGLRKALQQRNPKWGGPENLIASPQGEDPAISPQEMKQLIEQFIKIEKETEVRIEYGDDISYEASVSSDGKSICFNFPKYWAMGPVCWGVKSTSIQTGESDDGWRPAYQEGFKFIYRDRQGELPHFMAEKMTIAGKSLPEFTYKEFIALCEKIKKTEKTEE